MKNKSILLFLLLLFIASITYAAAPSQPGWIQTVSGGTTYNTRPFLKIAGTANTGVINDALVQIDEDIAFGSPVNYQYYASYLTCFQGMGVAAGTIVFRPSTVLTTGTWYVRVYLYNSTGGTLAERTSPVSATLTIYVTAVPAGVSDAITQGTTLVKAAHFNDLKDCIDNVRTFRGSAAYSYTATWPATSGSSQVSKKNIDDLRGAISEPFSRAVGTAPEYTYDATITAGTTMIRKGHMDELRTHIQIP